MPRILHCSVPGCDSKQGEVGASVSFHKFPKRAEIRAQWILKIRREASAIKESSRVCSQHFVEDDFRSHSQTKRLLKFEAVPSIFKWNRSSLVGGGTNTTNHEWMEESADSPNGRSGRSRKRDLLGLTGDQKHAICKYKEEYPTATQAQVAAHFSKLWNFQIARSTIGNIIRMKGRWLNENTAVNYIRLTKDEYQKLDADLYAWYQTAQTQGIRVTNGMLVEQEKRVGAQLGISNFPYSPRWLRGFKLRHGLATLIDRDLPVPGEKPGAVDVGREGKLFGFCFEDVYSVVQTSLSYCLEPDTSSWDPGSDTDNGTADRVLIFMCANVTGSDKLKPLVVGSAPLANDEESGAAADLDDAVHYRIGMNDRQVVQAALQDWMEHLDRQMAGSKREILLLFDKDKYLECNTKLSHVEMMALSAPTAHQVHAAVIENFKLHFGQFLLEHFRASTEDSRDFRLDLVDALRLIRASWDSVADVMIRDSKHFRQNLVEALQCAEAFWDGGGTSDAAVVCNKTEVTPDVRIKKRKNSDSGTPSAQCNSGTSLENGVKIKQEVLEDSGSKTDDQDEENGSERLPARVTAREARDAIKTIIEFFLEDKSKKLLPYLQYLQDALSAVEMSIQCPPLRKNIDFN